MNEQHVQLDVSKRMAGFQVVTLRRGDVNGTRLVASIYDGGIPLDLTGFDVFFEMLLPDGKTGYRVAGTQAGNVAAFEINEAFAASVTGKTDTAYVSVEKGGEVVCSTNSITVVVEQTAKDGKPPTISTPYIEEAERALQAAIGTFTEAANSENARVSAEIARRENEESRSGAEAARVSAESARASSESGRATAESGRVDAEQQRQVSEAERASAESEREIAEARRAADFAAMEQRSKGWLRYYCNTAGVDYDAATRRPIVAAPDEATLYYVPAENPTNDNQWVEWQYDASGSRWEKQGSTEVTISPMTTAQVDAVMDDGQTVNSADVVNGSVFSYIWAKLKQKFALITHVHAAADITSGALPVLHGGTGASTAADARESLGVYSEGEVDAALAGKSATGHTHDASDIASGTLPAERGGTGVSTAPCGTVLAGPVPPLAEGTPYWAEGTPDFRGLVNGDLPVVDVAHGGTGATTAADARGNLGASRGWYATCSTAAATVAKAATCSGFVLETGALVLVRFTNANTAASPTLNVNGTGAKAIYGNASTTAASAAWTAGETVLLVYDGAYWRMLTSFGNFGTLPVSKGGTGATDAAGARSNLGITPANVGAAPAAHDHSGHALAPASVAAAGTVKAATIEDSGGTLAALRESVSPRVLFSGDGADAWGAGDAKDLGAASLYGLYAAFSDGGATPMLGVTKPMSGGGYYLRLDGGYGLEGSHTSYMASFTVSAAGTWTLLACGYLGHSPSGGHGAMHAVGIGQVVRLL